MAVVCIICQEFLTERPSSASAGEEVVAVALTCGHTFHQSCVRQWFRGAGGANLPQGKGTCPSCKGVCGLLEAKRIFLSSEEDAAEAAAGGRNQLGVVIEENQRLEVRIQGLNRELRDERKEHEGLRIQYAEALSRIDELNDQLAENKNIHQAMENSVKTAMEKMEMDRQTLNLLSNLKLKTTESSDGSTLGLSYFLPIQD